MVGHTSAEQLAPTGSVRWAKAVGGIGAETAAAAALAGPEGPLLVAGTFASADATFGATLLHNTTRDGIIDATGTYKRAAYRVEDGNWVLRTDSDVFLMKVRSHPTTSHPTRYAGHLLRASMARRYLPVSTEYTSFYT